MCTLIVAGFMIPLAYAQDDSEVEESEAPVESLEIEAPRTDPLEAARAKGGDIVIMKSGAIMGGVQILKSTPTTYDIEVIPGAKPLTIPRRQVERVVYDDIDPARDARNAANRPKPQDDLMTDGKELSPELVDVLIKVIPDTPLTYTDQDYVKIFKEIGDKCNAMIIVDPSLSKLPPQTRHWTVEISEETKLMDVLQKLWLKKFPDGKITYEFDKVILHKKDVTPAPIPTQDPASATKPPAGLNIGGNN